MPEHYIKIDNQWKNIKNIYIKRNNSWTPIKCAFIKKNDNWELYHSTGACLGDIGDVMVTIEPNDAILAGAKWRIINL